MYKLLKHFIRIFLFATVLTIIISSCKKNETATPLEVSEIDYFIWNGLRQYYLWEDLVPNLDPNNFSSDAEIVEYINSFNGDHASLFYDLLYDPLDEWSWIVDDYEELENLLNGVTTSMGFEFHLGYIEEGGASLVGCVLYVLPGSPAAAAGMQRGDIFLEINDQQLTVSNSVDLLYGLDSYKISYADYIDGSFQLNGDYDQLIAEVVTENPIYYSDIFTVNGKKVAYLVYNGFTSTYDQELNTLFGTYATEGVEELILDLRYNGGGSVTTALYLASMIYGTNTENIFSKNVYNDLLTQYFLSEDDALSYFQKTFQDEIILDGGGTETINTLNLNQLYVLTSNASASASELLINGLEPYLNDVIVIGENTYGKYVGSFTIKDYDTHGVVNVNHKWAMQPICFKSSNSNDVTDFVNGLAPDYHVEEDYTNLLPFGNPDEPLFKAAIDLIEGNTPGVQKDLKSSLHFKSSKELVPFKNEMYLTIDKKNSPF